MRTLTFVDHLLKEMDLAIRTIFPPQNRVSRRPTPGSDLKNPSLTIEERKHIIGLLRVNHAGEVSAQALYQGQALTAQLAHVKEQMQEAALEEVDHLAWCEKRLQELGGETSMLNPFWYLGSLLIGATAGLLGDSVSLGFVAETENQVVAHLQNHLDTLPHQDEKTTRLFTQMLEDEAGHAHQARQAGALELPFVIKKMMQGVSKIMTKTAYYF